MLIELARFCLRPSTVSPCPATCGVTSIFDVLQERLVPVPVCEEKEGTYVLLMHDLLRLWTHDHNIVHASEER